jgi:hypothetical protein
MMTEPDQERVTTGGRYVGWDELHDLVSPRLGRDRFRALIKRKQDSAGFPPFDEEFAGFYWPKVSRWLDSYNKVGADKAVTDVEQDQDGPETFDAAPRKKARLQDRTARPAVLDRGSGHARPEGVSRHLHSVATGRDR